ncbi:aminotransferase class III-fold pyridoxal phosphate-dependent enzyme [Fodinibius sediminis]|uniref:Acetylornithine/succinyldiaminopimelate/putrescine aminotransferase n=1 Tax=Fodinibius sediminis TaxID=1214077 RepID=A0A521CY38_9BACT|nr:aminotransferase class III-fold pyridoxal phosphate-dependent enzyme [Fodinibius sediminis]SMO64386.1 Acetylornithine/succinyldiaminopimelate/putrescine aminotransferase [Fodinibius sediminis]
MRDSIRFDHIINADIKLTESPVQNLAELIFYNLNHRSEKGEIILGHDNKKLIRISLHRYRYIHLQLYKQFSENNIKQGDTMLLAGVPGNNEMIQALLFSALSSYGVRVFMPMFMETNELDEWLSVSNCRLAIIPMTEIRRLDHHVKAKAVVDDIIEKVQGHGIKIWDTFSSFNILHWLNCELPRDNFLSDPLVAAIVERTNLNQEALIITTSGSTGRSKLVVYRQGAFLNSCLSWQMGGMLEKSRLGGRGFTPLFTHTMGIRTFFNALWTGNPACLINTEWFEEQPEIVRYFLLKMKPEHITGGPAAFQLLLEMTRNFPELIPGFRNHFKTLVSSGAPFDSRLVQELQSIFELPIHNALGTTETQQVTNTMRDDPNEDPVTGGLGAPLPGVSLGLKRGEIGNTYRLFIKSPFGCSGILSKEGITPQDEYFYSGDIVELKKGKLVYAGRDGRDFFKDGFGVKIPINSVGEYYRELDPMISHIEFYTLQGEPGLAALVFVRTSSLLPGKVKNKEVITNIKSRLETINDQLFRELNPLEFRHRSIRRFTLLNAEPPKTLKGNVSQKLIQQKHASIILALRKYFVSEDWIHTVKTRQLQFDTFTEHANSYVGRYLRDLKMDLVYHRAEKDSLFAYREGKEIEILDLVGGYGGNLLGHNYPALRKALNKFLDRGAIAIANQGSIHNQVGRLAEKLNDMAGRETGRHFRTLFGSTGAEAVEMALHHACMEWRERMQKMERRQLQQFGSRDAGNFQEIWEQNRKKIETTRLGVITLKSAFHGHSTGARSLIGNKDQRYKFSNMLTLDSLPVDDSNPGWRDQIDQHIQQAHIELTIYKKRKGRIQTTTQRISTIIAAIAEPIAGEGGVRQVNRAVLRYLSGCKFPLILDEIQSGLGRSGEFLASKGIAGDYYLLGKSLGGGLEKISALLVDKNRYIDEFGKYYTTTFGNGELAARVAREMLSLVSAVEIPKRARERGVRLKNRLQAAVNRYPDVLDAVVGRGLMLGIRFRDFSALGNIFLRLMYRQEFLGYVCASYLLNRHFIRVLPTLSAPNVLRVEPSVFITDEEINQLGTALESLAEIIQQQSLYDLFLHFMEDDPFDDQKGYEPPGGLIYPALDLPEEGAKQVTFLAHFTSPSDELRILEPSFAKASNTGLRLLFNHLQVLMEMKPVTLFSKKLFGGRIHFQMKVIPLGSAELERMHREGKKREIIEKIQQGVDEAAIEGSEFVALGGYTSIFTNNGMALVEPSSTKIITGNTLTAASGIRRVLHEIKTSSDVNKPCTLGIVGAAGNIGRAITDYMSKQEHYFNRINLIVHNTKQQVWLEQQLQKSTDKSPLIEIACSVNMEHLRQCDVIVITTNANKPLVFPQHINPDYPVLISDNSVPSALSPEVEKMDRVTMVPFSSYLKLPMDPEFVISSHTPRGTAFCCSVEAMLCGLEEVNVPLRGTLEESSIELMMKLAEKWGLFGEFGTLSSFKSNAYF